MNLKQRELYNNIKTTIEYVYAIELTYEQGLKALKIWSDDYNNKSPMTYLEIENITKQL